MGLAATAANAASPAQGRKQPHIIFIMTDQQRNDAMGCTNEAVLSPNLDRLAADGYRFANAYSATPSSTPARAGLLTGMSPWHHGMLGYGQMAEHYKYEGPQMIKDAGYRTMAIGKNHWHPQTAKHGYELTLTDESGRVEAPDYTSDYRKWFNTQAFGLNPDSTHVAWNAHEGKAYALPERLHPTAWTGDRAVETIKGYCDTKPLMLKVSFARPHSPYDAPQRLVDMYQGREIPKAAIGEWCEKRPINQHPENNPEAAVGNFGEEYTENSRKHYYAAVTFIDEQIGRIIDELKAKGMYDDALIIFTSDHGDMLGDHNMWRKTYAYEGSAHVPFIVKLPSAWATEATPGSVMEQPVELRDILPTFLDAAGIDTPADMDGSSVIPLITGTDAPWREYIDLEHAPSYWDNNYWTALTDGKIKYIWFLRTGEEQLFDLQADPHETRNLAGSKKHRDTLEAMRSAMAEHLKERGEDWVKDGKLLTRQKSVLYSPNFPKKQ